MSHELPSELLLSIFSLATEVPSEVLEEYTNQEPGWLRVGKELCRYACVCRAWRMALVPPRVGGRERSDQNNSKPGITRKGVGSEKEDEEEEEEAFQSRLWRKVCLAQTRTSCWRISSGVLRQSDLIYDWYREFLTRARWYRRVHHCLKEEVVWPNIRAETLEELARNLQLSQSLLTEINNESSHVVGHYTRAKLEEENLRIIPTGNKYWSKEVLWKLKTLSAERRMERACNQAGRSEPVRVTGEKVFLAEEEEEEGEWERLCTHPEEVHIEEGALAIASLFNSPDEKEISMVLEELARELSKRMDVLAAFKHPSKDGSLPDISGMDVCRKRRLSESEQVAALNSLMFNRPRSTDEDITATPLLESLQAFRGASCAMESITAMQRFGWEEVLESWPGLGLRGNRSDYYNPKNSCISDILGIFFVPQRFQEEYEEILMSERRKGSSSNSSLRFLQKHCAPQEAGIPISIAVIYAAVGRRAGVPVRMISTPGHFLAGIGREVFVDVFSGVIKTREDIVSWMNQIYHISSRNQDEEKCIEDFLKCVTPKEINVRLCMNLIHIFEDVMDYKKLLSVVRLALVILPNNPDLLMKHAKVQAMLDEYDVAIQSLEQVSAGIGRDSQRNHLVDHCKKFINHFKMAKMLFLKDMSSKRFRPKGGQVLFRVGQVINHKRYSYRGVIYGWDQKCEAGERWIEQMRVDELPLGREQPFYRVLVDCRDRNSQSTYVAQENIRVEKDSSSSDSRLDSPQIDHPQIGQYFESYLLDHWHVKGQHYLPNALVKSQYPDD